MDRSKCKDCQDLHPAVDKTRLKKNKKILSHHICFQGSQHVPKIIFYLKSVATRCSHGCLSTFWYSFCAPCYTAVYYIVSKVLVDCWGSYTKFYWSEYSLIGTSEILRVKKGTWGKKFFHKNIWIEPRFIPRYDFNFDFIQVGSKFRKFTLKIHSILTQYVYTSCNN